MKQKIISKNGLSEKTYMNNQAQLWIGTHQSLHQEVITFLQKKLCQQNGCLSCIDCKKIQTLQHHAIMWISPEKHYTLSHIEPIFEAIAFRNDSHQNFYFVLEKADTLNPSCANSLLKSVEEPPEGYHFIFLAQRVDEILPTIRSRCTITNFRKQDNTVIHESFLHHFKVKTDAIFFLQTLEATQPNERESLELIDSLLLHWNTQYNQNPNGIAAKIIPYLQEGISSPPMPGSSKIFWKNIFLKVNSIIK